jgi:glycosyltransferase involved in cell wall biosynthesis
MNDGWSTERPWLSVIVPCRDGERWLAAALQSIVDQHESGIEVIFIDGSATDASLKIVDSFSHKLLIRAQRRPDLLSWTAKTNFGVEQARGDRICMLHVDDLWLPTRCAEIRKWLSAVAFEPQRRFDRSYVRKKLVHTIAMKGAHEEMCDGGFE